MDTLHLLSFEYHDDFGYDCVQYSTVLAAISYININIILNVNEGNKGCGCGKADICIDQYENSSPFQYHLTWL